MQVFLFAFLSVSLKNSSLGVLKFSLALTDETSDITIGYDSSIFVTEDKTYKDF